MPKAALDSPLASPANFVDVPKPPSFQQMMRTLRRSHPALTKPPCRRGVTLPDQSMMALLHFLDELDDGTSEHMGDAPVAAGGAMSDDGVGSMEVDGGLDEADEAACASKFREAYLLLLEHGLARYASRLSTFCACLRCHLCLHTCARFIALLRAMGSPARLLQQLTTCLSVTNLASSTGMRQATDTPLPLQGCEVRGSIHRPHIPPQLGVPTPAAHCRPLRCETRPAP
jgi:hypothetical protein